MNQAASPTSVAGSAGGLPQPRLRAGLANGSLVPPETGRRAPFECGDLPFLIKRASVSTDVTTTPWADGTWFYRGTSSGRKELVCLFASVLQREADGSFWLETPAERGRIEVEDAPFVAVGLSWSGDGREQVLSFRTNVDEVVTPGPITRSASRMIC